MTVAYDATEKIKAAGDDYLADQLLPQERETPDPDYGSGVPVAKTVHGSELVRIPLHPKTRVGIYGKSGSFKTILGKAFISRAVEEDAKVFVGGDLKNDFQSADYEHGASQSLQDVTRGLLPGEEPGPVATRLLVPLFLKEYYDGDPHSYAKLFSLDFPDVTLEQIRFLFSVDDIRSQKQRNIIENILIEHGPESLSWSKLSTDRLLPDNSSGASLETHLKPVRKKDILTSKSNSLESVLSFKGHDIVSLALKGWEAFYPNDMEPIQFYSAVLHQKVLSLAEERRGPVVVFDDEFHKLAPKSGSSRVKHAFQNLLDVQGRQAGVVTVQSSQRPDQVPDGEGDAGFDFLGPLSHAFLGAGLRYDPQAKRVFQAFNVYDPRNTDPLQRVLNQVTEGRFVYVHEDMQDPAELLLVEPLSPKIAHPEGDK